MLRDEEGEAADVPTTDAELLPDLIAGRLDDVTAARLRQALRTDTELQEEFGLIESIRRAAPAVSIDVARVAAAIPRPATTQLIDLNARRAARTRVAPWQWRAAAAVLLMVGGVGSVMIARNRTTSENPIVQATRIDIATGTLASAMSVDELTEEELELVLARMEQFDGATSVDSLDTGMEE
jgi:anti-sigma factor RsiW